MKAVRIAILGACALALSCLPAARAAEGETNNPAPPSEAVLSQPAAASLGEPGPDLTVPAPKPRKGFFKSIGNAGKKVVGGIVRDLNPLAPMPKAEEQSLEPVNGVSPRAWTTTVGWYPGSSMFPDAVVHSISQSR